MISRKKKEELVLKSGALFLLVELGEKRIVDVFQDLSAVKPAGEQLDERRLADADGSVDRDVPQLDIAFRRDRHCANKLSVIRCRPGAARGER